MCVCVCLHIYAHMYTCAPDTLGGQKKASDTLKLELWMLINPHGGARNQTQVLCKGNWQAIFIHH